jgi:dynein intermediate chain 2
MSEISYSFSRQRQFFGRAVEFQAIEPEILAEIAPNDELKAQHVAMDPYETEIQNVPTVSEAGTNTERIQLKHQGNSHIEGGWPLGIDPTEFEEKAKYCKKAERDDGYYATCKQLIERSMEPFLKQNNAVDIYNSFFAAATEVPDAQAPPAAKPTMVFKDPSAVKRAAVGLSWLGDGKKLAVAYCHLRFQSSVEGMSTASHIWDVTNPNEPIETLAPPSPLCCIEYYGKDPHLVAGGSYNGVVQYWDTRQPQRPVGRSAIEDSHKDAVWSVKWLQSKSGELLTVSTDGQAFIWDCRKFDKPTEIVTIKKFESESLVLQPKTNEGGARGVLGGTCIDYDAQVGGPAKYMIGTEQGTILSCNRKGKTMQDKIGTNTFNGHHGPVYAVQRNPMHPKFFLSVGDWTARVWCEDFKGGAMYSTYYHRAHLTNGIWHPQRCGVFMTTRMDGVVDIWDLTHRQSTPVLSVQVSDYALHSIRATHEGQVVAVGGVDGTTTLLQLSPSLYTSSLAEKNLVGRMFENESTRDKNLQTRAKEKTAKAKKAASSKGTQQDQGAALEESALQEVADRFLQDIGADAEDQKRSIVELDAQRRKLLQNVEDGLEVEDFATAA